MQVWELILIAVVHKFHSGLAALGIIVVFSLFMKYVMRLSEEKEKTYTVYEHEKEKQGKYICKKCGRSFDENEVMLLIAYFNKLLNDHFVVPENRSATSNSTKQVLNPIHPLNARKKV